MAMTKEYDPERDGPKRPRPPIDKMYRPGRDGPKTPVRKPSPFMPTINPDLPGSRPGKMVRAPMTARGGAIMRRLNK